jgi:hypothetical protein
VKEWQQNILILTISILLAFLGGELYLRLLDSKKPPTLLMSSANEKLVYELNPRCLEVNSFRMRQDNFSEKDLNDSYIIAAIGDSHTFSSKVKDWHNTYPHKLENYLNTLSSDTKVRVLNFGVSGYNTAQELELLKSKVLQFHPNLIILQVAINDTHVCNYIQPENKHLNHLIYRSRILVFCWKKFLYSNTSRKYFYNWFRKYLPDSLLFQERLVGTMDSNIKGELPAHLGHPARTKDRVPLRYHYMLGEENWKKHICDFAKIAKVHNIPIIATGFIENWQRVVLLDNGFKIYTFDEIFGVIDKNVYGYDPLRTSSHFNEKGYDVIGKKLADVIFNLYLKNEHKTNQL